MRTRLTRPGGRAAPVHRAAAQARVVRVQRVCAHLQELHPDGVRHQGRLADRARAALLRPQELPQLRGQADAGAHLPQEGKSSVEASAASSPSPAPMLHAEAPRLWVARALRSPGERGIRGRQDCGTHHQLRRRRVRKTW